MTEKELSIYWQDIPTNKRDAATYPVLMQHWQKTERAVRAILHELSLFDNGDNFILIRSSASRGFYKTDDEAEIKAYKKECLNKGRSVFAPVKKINRVLAENSGQYSLANNLRIIRERAGLKQSEVCKQMKTVDKAFDKSLLSKMENSICMPTRPQLYKLSQIYACEPFELINEELL